MDNDKKVNLLKEKLLKSMTKKRLRIMSDIIKKKNPCSLRIIEWFVSSYSKDYNTSYKINNLDFKVYSSYKNEQMASFNKKLFDMYRRMPKFNVKIDDEVLETTVAQLNFFDWLFKYKVLDYIILNLDKIKKNLESSKPTKKQKLFFEDIKVSRINITIIFD